MESGKELYTVSRHAKERYAERCTGKEAGIEVQAYLAEHEARIQEEMNQMIQHGNLIYTGKPRGTKDESVLEVYIQGLWIILANAKTRNIITIYKVNLGCGPDLDRMYVERMLEKLDTARNQYDTAKRELEAQNRDYRDTIRTGNEQIKEYRTRIRKLEEMCEGYNTVISSNMVTIAQASDAMAEITNTLIGKKTF